MVGSYYNADYVTTTEILSRTSLTWRTSPSLSYDSSLRRKTWFYGLVYQGHLYWVIQSDNTVFQRLDQETETWEKPTPLPDSLTPLMDDPQLFTVPDFC